MFPSFANNIYYFFYLFEFYRNILSLWLNIIFLLLTWLAKNIFDFMKQKLILIPSLIMGVAIDITNDKAIRVNIRTADHQVDSKQKI